MDELIKSIYLEYFEELKYTQDIKEYGVEKDTNLLGIILSIEHGFEWSVNYYSKRNKNELEAINKKWLKLIEIKKHINNK